MRCVAGFIAENPQYVAENNAMGYMSEDGGNSYNLCHCESRPLPVDTRARTLTHRGAVWSNFEIGDLDFWPGETYMKFFEFLDQKGGFYYEVRICTGC